MDIATLVRNVVAAFDDAVNLVRRIQDRKDVKDDPNAITDLITSLSLGPVVIKGYYDSDVKRFGDAYTVGDQYARDQLKDVLIYLQMSLLTTLRTVLLDEQILDQNALLEASDNCRVNAGVCLGQLSQRLAEQARLYAQGPPAYPSSPYMGSLHHSSSQSTHSSSGRGRTPDPNMNLNHQFVKMNLNQQSFFDPTGQYGSPKTPTPRRPSHSRQDSMGSPGSEPTTFFFDKDAESPSNRRRSSHTLPPEDVGLLSPMGAPPGFGSSRESPIDVLPGAQDLYRESYMTLGGKPIDSGQLRDSSNSLSSSQPRASRDHFDPEDFSPVLTLSDGAERAFASLYVSNNGMQPSRAASRSYGNQAYGAYPPEAHEGMYQMQQDLPQPLRPGHQQRQDPNSYGSQHPNQASFAMPPRKPLPMQNQMDAQFPYHYNHNMPRPSIAAPIPVHTEQNLPAISYSNASHPAFAQPQYQQPQSPPPQSYAKPQSPLQQYQNQRQRNDSNPYSAQSSLRSPPPPVPAPRTPGQAGPNNNLQSPAWPNNGAPVRPASNNTPTGEPNNVKNAATSNPTSIAPSIRSNQPSVLSTGPLTLPTEKNTLGLCKGAFRLFIGLEKKAFSPANRPVGMSSFAQSWRCEKCNFEGPMREIPSSDPKLAKKGKREKCFDTTVREMYGVRYRWAFLAKCHVALKSVPAEGKARLEGSFGSFGCLLCAAEASNRGWTNPAGVETASISKASVKSGSSGQSGGSGQTPIFGNLQSFMEHLYKHRSEDWWPNAEMQGRMKCIVGRVAEPSDEFDVNFTPLGAN